jgi:hypothetical protein
MWPWMKRWRDWVVRDLWPMTRSSPQSQALYYSYEKGGLTVADQPIPWNAEAVLVEALLRLPTGVSRRKGDFTLICPGREPAPVDQLRRQEGDDRYRLTFRIPPPTATTVTQICYRDHVLGEVKLPFLSRDEFIGSLRLQTPTLYVRMGEETVACQTFVATQCRGLVAGGLLTSPTSLAPLRDLDLQVEFRCERGTQVWRVPACLASSQLAGRQALLTVAPRRHPRRLGAWTATWLLGDRPLASQRIRGISQSQFRRSLRLSDTRFVVQAVDATVRLTRQAPAAEGGVRVGPCFLVSSAELGMAGLCRLRVAAQVSGALAPPLLLEQDVLITDGPAMVAPGTLDAVDLAQVTGFELTLKGRILGVLSLRPAPTATFTNEGGFRPPSEFNWSPAAEEEMTERLNRLFGGNN